MTEYVVHELNCEKSTAIYRTATDAEEANIKLAAVVFDKDEKLESLKTAAKNASPEMYALVMYLLGGDQSAYTE